MVVWNDLATSDNPVLETLYLGNAPETIDVWGRIIVPEQLGTEQIIPVTQMPIFVTGLNIDVVRFRLSMQTHVNTISAVPNQRHVIPFSYRNDTAVPISIQITPQMPRPRDWTITPPTQTLNLDPGREGESEFVLTLLPSGDTGRRLFKYNVRITGINAPEFAVYDEMMIGNPDVYFEFVSRMTETGEIELIKTFINNTEDVFTYNLRLTIPNRPPHSALLRQRGFGRVERTYMIPRGQALLTSGVTEMILRVEPRNDGGVLGEPMVYTIPLLTE